MSYTDSSKTKLNNQSAKIGVIGLGYVGLPLAIAFCDAGYEVTGFDVDNKKCQSINNAETYIEHISADRYQTFANKKQLTATGDFTALSGMDVIMICVPTPLDDHRVPDLSYVAATADTIAANTVEGQLVILESSTYPGTTREILAERLENAGFHDGENIFVAFSPEREDPSNPDFTTRTIPKVIGADHEDSRMLASLAYEKIVDTIVLVSSTKAAEATKLTENIFRAANIALVNELKVIYECMDIDIWEVIDAASTKPFGFMPFYPGPGLGGHCIPIDPFYLSWKAREHGLSTRFIELAGEINTNMPYYVIDKLTVALSNMSSKSLKGSKILLIGMAYKKNVDDDRESPAYKIMDILEDRGACVDYHDPHIPFIGETRKYSQLEGRCSIDLVPETVKNYDAIIIVTAHDNVDYNILASHGQLIIDTRNVMSEYKSNKVVKA